MYLCFSSNFLDMLFKAKAITKMDVKISSDNLVLESHEVYFEIVDF